MIRKEKNTKIEEKHEERMAKSFLTRKESPKHFKFRMKVCAL